MIRSNNATEAKQDILNAKDFATQTTLAAVLAKIITAPATEAKQDTLIAKDFATQTTLAAILAKIIATPATEATLASVQATLAQGGIPATTLETTHQNAATTDGNGTAATVSGYGPIAFQATGTFDTATVTYKGSVDGTNYEALPGSSAVTVAGISKFDVSGYKSVLAVISGAGASTSLTVKSLAVGVARPLTADVITVGKAADNAAANGNPVLLAGKYNATPTTRDEGDAVTLQTDAQGNLLTKLTGSNATEPFFGSSSITHTFTKTMYGFVISNDDDISSLTFTIGTDTFTVLPRETWDYPVAPFTEVTVTTSIPFRAWGRC